MMRVHSPLKLCLRFRLFERMFYSKAGSERGGTMRCERLRRSDPAGVGPSERPVGVAASAPIGGPRSDSSESAVSTRGAVAGLHVTPETSDGLRLDSLSHPADR